MFSNICSQVCFPCSSIAATRCRNINTREYHHNQHLKRSLLVIRRSYINVTKKAKTQWISLAFLKGSLQPVFPCLSRPLEPEPRYKNKIRFSRTQCLSAKNFYKRDYWGKPAHILFKKEENKERRGKRIEFFWNVLSLDSCINRMMTMPLCLSGQIDPLNCVVERSSAHPACSCSLLNAWIKTGGGFWATSHWIPCAHYGWFSEHEHISISFFFPPLLAWVWTDPARPLGSLIIPALRPECKNGVFWLRGCTYRYGRRHGQCQGSFSRECVDVTLFASSRD